MNKRQRKKLENKFGCICLGRGKNKSFHERKADTTLKAGRTFSISSVTVVNPISVNNNTP